MGSRKKALGAIEAAKAVRPVRMTGGLQLDDCFKVFGDVVLDSPSIRHDFADVGVVPRTICDDDELDLDVA
jgi:hypothetical protein